MKRIVTVDDFLDAYLKSKQRGLRFLVSKFTFSKKNRTVSAFNETAHLSSNWWTIPYVTQRWNRLITGDKSIDYRNFLVQEVLKNKKDVKLLSLGTGTCSNEIALAKNKVFGNITCVDLTQYRLSQAKKNAANEGLNNLTFICSDIENYSFPENHFDVVLFNSSLHHFKNVDQLLSTKINKCLKDSGLLVVNEYVGPTRLQFPKNQLKEINRALKIIPKKYRQRYKTTLTKNFFTGPGLLRMILADPSECIDSSSILPAIHTHFKTVIEKPYGGNIIMNVLKDISHHFIELNDEKKAILDELFRFEDNYLKNNDSDFVFGVYKKQ